MLVALTTVFWEPVRNSSRFRGQRGQGQSWNQRGQGQSWNQRGQGYRQVVRNIIYFTSLQLEIYFDRPIRTHKYFTF